MTNAVIISEDQAVKHETSNSTSELGEKLRQDRLSEDLKMQQLQNERLAEETETLKTNRDMREKLIKRLTCLSYIWLAFTGIIVILHFFGCGHLSDMVATAFITTSLATVLGLWVIGLRYFFSPDNSTS